MAACKIQIILCIINNSRSSIKELLRKNQEEVFRWLGGLFFPQEHISFFKKLLFFPDLKFETKLEF